MTAEFLWLGLGLALGVLGLWLAMFPRRSLLRAQADAQRQHAESLAVALEDARAKLAELQAENARLGERLAAEQRLGVEKLAVLERAREQLGDTFKAISGEALKASNESFLRLAAENLGRFQEGARAELKAREQAIDNLTKPIRDRLEKFDGKLDEIEKAPTRRSTPS